jgi:hypothetical protein
MWGHFNQLNLMALIHITETACDEGDGSSHLTSGKAKAVRTRTATIIGFDEDSNPCLSDEDV